MKGISFHWFTLIFLFLPIIGLNAEVFRVHKTHILQIPETGEIQCRLGINDAAEIRLPQDTTFIQGIEVEIKIPEVISRYHGSVAYSFYTGINPVPTAEQIDYSGTRENIDTLPGRLSMNLTIPTTQDHNIKASPYTNIQPVIYSNRDSIFIRFQLVMKGIPESFDQEDLVLIAKPVYTDKGIIQIETLYPFDQESNPIKKPYSIIIDEQPVTMEEKGVILDTGMHHLSIVSDFYRNETRTFTIEQAKVTNVQIQLRDIAPTLQIIAPKDTIIFFDNMEMENTKDSFIISQGEHIIKMQLSDYEITKTIQASNGRSYTVNLTLDLEIEETQ
ncbi:MAG: hypothetical protein J6B32_04750 [Spirochaetaceae bacterium]|nr:hypothetical protein [Spirochaetaceae bacterium]